MSEENIDRSAVSLDEQADPEVAAVQNAPIEETAREKDGGGKKEKKPKEKAAVIARRYCIIGLIIIASAILRALSIHIFVVPNQFAPGGVTGIATMIENFTGLSSGIFIFAINMPLLIASFFLISKRFAIISAIGTVLQSGMLVVFDMIEDAFLANPIIYTENPALAAIAGGVLGGAGIGLMLKIGGSSGGTDIIATYIYKHFSATNISWFIFMLDSVVVVISFFIYQNNFTPVLLSFAEMYASAKASDLVVCGFKGAVKFEIITSSGEELSKELMARLHRGVTAIEAKGMYTGASKTMLVCLVRRSQISMFQKILAGYPDTFAYISSATDVIGQGFKSDITS